MINKERLVNAFCELVKIDSPSDEEEDVAKHLTERAWNLWVSALPETRTATLLPPKMATTH